MHKLLPALALGVLGLAYVAKAYPNGAASCTMPSHGVAVTPGMGGFMVEFIDVTPGSPMQNSPVMKYVAGRKYQVVLSNSVNYKGFLAGFTTGTDLGSGSVTGLHLLSGDSQDIQSTSSLPCSGMTHTSARRSAPRMMDKFTWQAPGTPGFGDVSLSVIGVKEKQVFHKFSVWFNETMPTMTMTDTRTATRTPTATNQSRLNDTTNNGPPLTGCMAHMTCGGCSMDNMCRWCASSGKCEPKDKPTKCDTFGCLKCGTQVMPNYICNPESVNKGGMCQCKDGARKWCNMGQCQMRASCGSQAAANQPCTANTIRAAGAPITQAANCVCRTLFTFTPTCGSPSGPPCKLDASTVLAALNGDTGNTPFNLPDGSSLDLSTNLNLGTAMLKFGTGAASETGAATSTAGLRTIVSQSVDFDVEEFESEDVEFDVTNINFKRAMSWAGARCKVAGMASFEADVTFSGTGGNFEVSATATVTSNAGTRVSFGTGFDLKTGGSFTAGGPLEFGSTEEVTMVKIDGSLTAPDDEILLGNDADIQISGTIDAADPANPPTIRGYGCKFQGTAGATVNGVVEFYTKPTSSAGHKRHALAQVEDSTGYSNTLGGAIVHNAWVEAHDTWVNPMPGFLLNAGVRLASDSALYFGDAFDLSAANFGTTWNGLVVTGTATLDNCVIVLDLGNSATTGDFPTSDPFILLEADAIVGTAFITVAADEAMGGTTMWSAKIVQNGARWQLQAVRHTASAWADTNTNIRSKLWGVYITKADWPTLDASNFATTLDTAITAVWMKNAAAWASLGFMSEVHKVDSTDATYFTVYFTYNAPAATIEYINDVIVNLFRYDGSITFYAASPLKPASPEFQCATSDDPAPADPVYACHPDYFTAHGACMAQNLNDVTCGAARKEMCTVRPSDSPHCFLVE